MRQEVMNEVLLKELEIVNKWAEDQKGLWFWEKLGRIPFMILDRRGTDLNITRLIQAEFSFNALFLLIIEINERSVPLYNTTIFLMNENEKGTSKSEVPFTLFFFSLIFIKPKWLIIIHFAVIINKQLFSGLNVFIGIKVERMIIKIDFINRVRRI